MGCPLPLFLTLTVVTSLSVGVQGTMSRLLWVLVVRVTRRGGSQRDAIRWLRMHKLGACVVQGCEQARQLVECQPQLARHGVEWLWVVVYFG